MNLDKLISLISNDPKNLNHTLTEEEGSFIINYLNHPGFDNHDRFDQDISDTTRRIITGWCKHIKKLGLKDNTMEDGKIIFDKLLKTIEDCRQIKYPNKLHIYLKFKNVFINIEKIGLIDKIYNNCENQTGIFEPN